MSFIPFFTGLGVFGLLQALSGICLWRFDFMRETIAMCVTGNLIAGIPLWLGFLAIRKMFKRGPADSSLTFWCGASFAIASFLESPAVNLFASRDNPGIGLWGGVLFSVLLAPRLAKHINISAKSAKIQGVIVVAAWLVAWANLLPESETKIGSISDKENAAQISHQQPDVILISVDTLRADAIVGPNSATVPSLDRLRASGTWSAFARSSSNQTVPGHTGMLAGLNTLHHGVLDNTQHFPTDIKYLADYFSEAGWNTGGVVSNALLSKPMGPHRSFDIYEDKFSLKRLVIRLLRQVCLIGSFFDSNKIDRVASRFMFNDGQASGSKDVLDSGIGANTTRQGLSFVKQLSERDAPFFLFLHYMDPHGPYVAPAPFANARTKADADGNEQQLLTAVYLEEVDFLDSQLDQVITAIEATGRPSVIVFTSDHGEFLLEHNLTGHSHDVYEEVIRVPLIISGDQIPHNELADAHLEDIAPTVLSRCGIAFDKGQFDGVNLLDGPLPNRLHIARDRSWISISEGDWKWMAPLDGSGLAIESEGGYNNLSVDPHENSWPNTLEPPAAFSAKVQATLSLLQATSGAVEVTAGQELLLQELGYADLLED